MESCMPKGLVFSPLKGHAPLCVWMCVPHASLLRCPVWSISGVSQVQQSSGSLRPPSFGGGRLSWLPVSPVSGFLLPADYRDFILRDRETWHFRIIWAFFRKLQYSLETKLWKSESQGIHNPVWDCFFLFEEIWAHLTTKVTLNILKWQPLPLQLWYVACSLKKNKFFLRTCFQSLGISLEVIRNTVETWII